MRMFIFFGPKAKYSTFSWWENFFSGHISIGPITIYGDNAMLWAVNIRTRKFGYICFTLPSLKRWKQQKISKPRGFYFYLSPNGTPWAATFYRGCDKKEKIRAQIRKLNFGHAFDTNLNREKLSALNNKFDWFEITEYDLQNYGPCNQS